MDKIAKPGEKKIVDLQGNRVQTSRLSEGTKANMIAALEKLVEGFKSGDMRMPESIILIPRFENEAQLIYLGEPVPQDMVYAQLSKFVARMALQ